LTAPDWTRGGRRQIPAKSAQWTVANGIMTIAPGSGHIATARSVKGYQLHLEWQIPDRLGGKGQQRGNSGVFLASTHCCPE